MTLNLFFILDKPGPCIDFKKTSVAETTIGLAWQTPADDGGREITHYIVQKRDTKQRSWGPVSKPEETECMAQGLIEGTTYQFQVAAENEVGVGPFVELPEPVTAKSPHGKYN